MVASEVESSTCLLSSSTCRLKVETWRAESKDIFIIGQYFCCFFELVASDRGPSPTERGYTVRFGLQLLHFVIQVRLYTCMDKTKLQNETIWNVLLSNFCIFMNCLILFFKLLFSGVYMIRIWSLTDTHTHTKKIKFPEEEGKWQDIFDKMLHQKTLNICNSVKWNYFKKSVVEFLMTFKFLLNDWTMCLCLVELLLHG